MQAHQIYPDHIVDSVDNSLVSCFVIDPLPFRIIMCVSSQAERNIISFSG